MSQTDGSGGGEVEVKNSEEAEPCGMDLRVVLVNTRNSLNIGAAARAMSNFGFRRLRVVRPYEPSFREAQSAVGAADLLAGAEVYESVADAVADCTLVVGTTAVRQRGLQHPVDRLEDSATRVRSAARVGTVALLFGSEKRGLSNDDLTHCHRLLRIPTHEGNISMNLGQAVAVCLYELARRDAPVMPITVAEPATAEAMERLDAVLMQTLDRSGYIKPNAATSTQANVRRLLRRLNVSAEDAETLTGMMRQLHRATRKQE